MAKTLGESFGHLRINPQKTGLRVLAKTRGEDFGQPAVPLRYFVPSTSYFAQCWVWFFQKSPTFAPSAITNHRDFKLLAVSDRSKIDDFWNKKSSLRKTPKLKGAPANI